MSRSFKHSLLLSLILLIAFFFRFHKLEHIPVSLSHDEVAIGYNAYSILQTGRDEYGRKLPILFRSFEDYKLPGYIYFTSVSEYFFGLTPFAVRFTSAFLGSLTIVSFYFLLKAVVKNSIDNTELFSLIGALILSISPWHINFSRGAFEANGSLFFIVLGFALLFYAQKRRHLYVLSVLFLSISVYFYYTARILVPLLTVLYFFINKDLVLKHKRQIISSLILGIIITSPILYTGTREGLSRVSQVSIFNDKSLTNPYSQEIVNEKNTYIAKAIYNRRIAFFQEFSENYLKNFAPDFLFTNGTGPIGLAYIWELPFFIFGFIKSFSLKSKNKWFMLGWFLIAPLAAGLTTGQPNALRTLANVPALIFYSTLGLSIFLTYKQIKKPLTIAMIIVVVIFFNMRFYSLYFNYNPKFVAQDWGDGNMQLVDYVNSIKKRYDVIYITGANWRPYIHYLFYSKYDPIKYQKDGSVLKVENIRFGIASWDKSDGVNLGLADLETLLYGKTLFVLTKDDLESHRIKGSKLKIIKTINGRYIKSAFIATETY